MRRALAVWLAAVTGVAALAPSLARGGDPSLHYGTPEEYREIAARMAGSPDLLPIRVESHQERELVQGDVYSIVEQPYDVVRSRLESTAQWCALLHLHLNVKACTHASGSSARLTLYLGRKFYQEPRQARRLALDFAVLRSDRDRLEIALRADEGPMGTRDYTIALAAMPLGDGRSFIHSSYSHGLGFVSRVALFSYLKTVGRKKVGFSRIGRDDSGRPVLAGGVQGMIERNAMRYHLAIQAYLETLRLPEQDRLEARARRWFELTGAYPTQLFEIPREQYLQNKRREWANQSRMQAELRVLAGRTPAAVGAAGGE